MKENRIVKQLIKSFDLIKKRGWEKIYIAVDIHETLMEPTWSDVRSHKFYPCAEDAMRLLAQRKDVCLILWTCSNEENTDMYMKEFNELGFNFMYANCNPEVTDTSYADYTSKFYVNVILDDKAGFLPEDWEAIYNYLLNQ